jgi:hypothetical protein
VSNPAQVALGGLNKGRSNKSSFSKTDGFVRTKTRLLNRSPLTKISPLNKLRPFSFHVDCIARMHGMFLEIDEGSLSRKKKSFRKKTSFLMTSVFLKDVFFCKLA